MVAFTSLASPLAAQHAGTVEFGALGRASFFDPTLGLQDYLGVGGRFAVFIVRNLAIEGDASYIQTNIAPAGRVTNIPIHARAVYNIPFHDRLGILVGFGYARNEYTRDVSASDNGVGGLFGVRIRLSEVVSLRAEGTLDYTATPINAAPGIGSNTNGGAQFGMSVQFGPRGDRDGDADGVRDQDDRCPGTRYGEPVDAAGCALDTDGDGVANSADRCPNTPAGEVVDASGCRLDTDGDGVADSDDRCPNTPTDTAVDEAGCARDADADGVADSTDKCPNTPSGAVVDAEGCPVDGDGDGVADGLDKCPNTEAGIQVDEGGCPALFEKGKSTVVLEGVNFRTNSAELTAEARMVLRRVAESLVANPEVRVEVAGHSDATGSRNYNIGLSASRAESVRAFLSLQGVAPERMRARGYGPDLPIANNGTRSGRALNRRVELRRIEN
jgi:outer membrane protein OmpA-like peptidoglycan-associated protein